MSNSTNDNFWLALSQYVPPDVHDPIYRLYYNELGDVLFYSM